MKKQELENDRKAKLAEEKERIAKRKLDEKRRAAKAAYQAAEADRIKVEAEKRINAA